MCAFVCVCVYVCVCVCVCVVRNDVAVDVAMVMLWQRVVATSYGNEWRLAASLGGVVHCDEWRGDGGVCSDGWCGEGGVC